MKARELEAEAGLSEAQAGIAREEVLPYAIDTCESLIPRPYTLNPKS
jgi:hypothetical protein